MGSFAQAGGLQPNAADQLLFMLQGANLQLAGDQQFTRIFGGTSYSPSKIIARQRSGAAGALGLGGIYDGANKGGNAIVTAAQAWTTLANGAIVTVPTANVLISTLLSGTPYLNLSSLATGACLADIWIFGYDLS